MFEDNSIPCLPESSHAKKWEKTLGTRAGFPPTRWSLILRLKQGFDPTALAELCSAYWYPLYARVRWRGYNASDAADLVQGFFLRILTISLFEKADQEKARLRSFLVQCLDNYINTEWSKHHTIRRGGRVTHQPIDFESGEERFQLEGPSSPNPEKEFDRNWAAVILGRALMRTRKDYEGRGRGERFEALLPCLCGDRSDETSEAIGARMGMEGGAVRQAIFRMRHRVREFLLDEVRGTLAAEFSEEEVREEAKYLLSLIGS